MPVPTYDLFIEPILRYLASNPGGARTADAQDAAADTLGLRDEDRALLLPSGRQAVYKNRAGWAFDRLKRAGLALSPQRGQWRLNDAGFAFARDNPSPLSEDAVEKLATGNRTVRLRPLTEGTEGETSTPKPAKEVLSASPDDRLEAALTEIRESVADELLELLLGVDPAYFESIVLDVLHRMGYGTHRGDAHRVGRSGDGGIDGVISLDKLGLEKVYIQAKRWQNSVGSPEVQAFYGALAGRRANKGVFITTSTFTPAAVAFAASVERIVLIDGEHLAQLMIDHEVGVSLRSLSIPKIDSDYFES